MKGLKDFVSLVVLLVFCLMQFSSPALLYAQETTAESNNSLQQQKLQSLTSTQLLEQALMKIKLLESKSLKLETYSKQSATQAQAYQEQALNLQLQAENLQKQVVAYQEQQKLSEAKQAESAKTQESLNSSLQSLSGEIAALTTEIDSLETQINALESELKSQKVWTIVGTIGGFVAGAAIGYGVKTIIDIGK